MLTLEVLGYKLVPKGDVCLAVVDDGAKLGMLLKLLLEGIHALDTLDEIDHALLIILLVKGQDNIFYRFTENGRQALTHGGVGERIPGEKEPDKHATHVCSGGRTYSW